MFWYLGFRGVGFRISRFRVLESQGLEFVSEAKGPHKGTPKANPPIGPLVASIRL